MNLDHCTRRLTLCPITIGEARTFIARHHRHHGAPQSGLFAVAVTAQYVDEAGCYVTLAQVVGVAVIGRPIARAHQNGYTAEVTRVCVLEGFPNACSMLYGAAWRACRALGYQRLITYTLVTEPGSSLRAAGWRLVGRTRAESWNRPSRPRVDRAPPAQRSLWERSA